MSAKYSIIIPSSSRHDLLAICLDSIVKHSNGVETVVVLNGADSVLKGVTKGYESKYSFIKAIEIDRKGYTVACNEGAKVATGKVLVFLNDDTIVSPGWLGRMNQHFIPNGIIRNPGMVGPVSNFAAGIQNQRVTYDVKNFDKYADKYYSVNRGKSVKTAFLSGFCMMIKKDVFEEVGGLDEDFNPGSFDDNDLVLRLINKGYDAVVAADVFIHHFGSQTVSQMGFNTLSNVFKFHKKWKIEGQKVFGAMRVKNGLPFIKESLPRLRELCDDVVVVDTGSTDGTVDYLKDNGYKYKIYTESENEVDQRNYVLDFAREEGADWVMTLDCDEVMDETMTKEDLEYLINPPDPTVFGYVFRFANFWRGRELVRIDGPWGYMKNTRLFKLLPSLKLYSEHPQGLHCSAADVLPLDSVRFTPFRIKHYGYSSPEIVKKKYEYYTHFDEKKEARLIGTPNYDHFKEDGLTMAPYVENDSLSLAVNAKDDYYRLYNLLKKYFAFAHEVLIGVDSRAVKETKEVASMFKTKMIDIKWTDDYADMRNQLIKHCSKKWTLVMDTDEDFENPLLIHRMLDLDSVDAYLFTVYNYLKSGKVSVTENPRLFKNDPRIKFDGICHETVEKSLKENNFVVVKALTRLEHYGFLQPDKVVHKKLDTYKKLNEKQIQMFPNDPKGYFNLALHYINEGDDMTAEKLFLKALSLDRNASNTLINYSALLLRRVMSLLDIARANLDANHPKRKFVEDLMVKLKPYIEVVKI